MKELFIKIFSNKPLVLIIVISVFLRFAGIYPGYPTHPDEAPYGSAYTMIMKGNLDPARYDYPAGIALIHWFIFKFLIIPLNWGIFYITHIEQLIDGGLKIPLSQVSYDRFFRSDILGRQELNILYWGRYLTALFGVGVVYLTYFLSKKLFGSLVALSSAFFVAVNFREVLNSHIGLPDIYNAFFLLLSIIALFKILETPSRKNYILTGIANALYFSTKFQVFSFLPFLLAHLVISYQKSKGSILLFIKSIFSLNFILALGIIPILIAIINPYHLINFELFKETQGYVASKYAMGTNVLNIYPISYLYHIGIGEILSILILLGVILGLIKYTFKTLLLLSVVVPFLFVFLYYSRGGFYTRNFVTIIPILLIFAGISIQLFYNIISRYIKRKQIIYFICFMLVLIISWSNIEKSLIIVKEYSKPWNINVLSSWLVKNIPAGSTISAHSNVPLPIDDVKRLTYEPGIYFSIDEFKEEGTPDYAIANFAWATNGFYWWMGAGNPKEDILYYWEKPLHILEYSYPAIALRELEPFMVYSVFKPWQAPDTEFYVAKIPKYTVGEKNKIVSYSFDKDTDGWKKEGKFWTIEDNLSWGKGNLIIEQKPIRLTSLRWQSPIIEINNWSGYVIEFKTITESTMPQIRAGYLFANFYKSLDDAKNSKNRAGVRVSSRTNISGKWLDKSLIGNVPGDAKYMTIGFYSEALATSFSKLDSVTIYKADVVVDYGGVKLNPIHIDEGNLFPNSHGNL